MSGFSIYLVSSPCTFPPSCACTSASLMAATRLSIMSDGAITWHPVYHPTSHVTILEYHRRQVSPALAYATATSASLLMLGALFIDPSLFRIPGKENWFWVHVYILRFVWHIVFGSHTTMSVISIGTETDITGQQKLRKHFAKFLYRKYRRIVWDVGRSSSSILKF